MALFDPSQFNPSTYQTQALPGWLMHAFEGLLGQSAGFPAATGAEASSVNRQPQAPQQSSYLLPSIPSQTDSDGMAGYSPESALVAQRANGGLIGMLPQAPQMDAQGVPAQPTPSAPQPPGFLDRLGAGLAGFANSGVPGARTLTGSLGGMADGFSSGVTPQNQTVAALVKNGIEPEMAKIVARNPQLLSAVVQGTLGIKGTTSDIKEFEYAKKQGFQGTFDQWLQRKRVGAGEYSLNPIYGTDADGKPVVLQLGKSGEAIKAKVPEGVNISTGVDKIDLGTQWGLIDKRSGQIVGYQPKDIVGQEAAKVTGKTQGEAAINLPATLAKAEQALSVIDKMISHPGRAAATGKSGAYFDYLPDAVTPQSVVDFRTAAKQLEGKAFLEAFESLKGGGQITEIEGKKATEAIARLNRAQSEGEYLVALKELRGIIIAGMGRARVKAGKSPQAERQASSPASAPIDPLGIR